MKKTQALRHGEIGFEKIDKLPENLEKSNIKEFLKGSHGNSHSYDKGEFYPKVVDDFIFGYFVAKDTTLTHPEHGEKEKRKVELKKAKLPDGIYCLRRQNEVVNDELKQVID